MLRSSCIWKKQKKSLTVSKISTYLVKAVDFIIRSYCVAIPVWLGILFARYDKIGFEHPEDFNELNWFILLFLLGASIFGAAEILKEKVFKTSVDVNVKVVNADGWEAKVIRDEENTDGESRKESK